MCPSSGRDCAASTLGSALAGPGPMSSRGGICSRKGAFEKKAGILRFILLRCKPEIHNGAGQVTYMHDPRRAFGWCDAGNIFPRTRHYDCISDSTKVEDVL